jgi:tetratricopeptide (TPR) repeat protein
MTRFNPVPRRLFGWITVLGVSLWTPPAAMAQSDAERAMLAAFIDSVDAARTITAVDSFATKWDRKQPSGMNEMRRGVLDWHRGRLADDPAYYTDAVKEFDRATQRASDWPYPWYLLAVLRLEMLAEAYRVPGVTMQKGAAYRRYYEEGLHALDRSLEADTSFSPSTEYVSANQEWLEWLRTEDVAEALKASWEEDVQFLLAEGPPAPKWVPPATAAFQPGELSPASLALGALRDSLMRLVSPEAVRAVPDRWDPAINFFDPEWGALRLGFIELRVAELTEDSLSYRQALESFGRANSLAPTEPYVWYGAGLSQLGLRWLATRDPSIVEPNAGYKAYYEPAMEAISRSLELDPGFAPSLELVVAMALEEADRVQPSWVLEAVKRSGTINPALMPQVHLIIGRHDRNKGDAMAGLTEFEEFIRTGGDTGVAALELARTLADLEYLEPARQAYLAGLDRLSPAARLVYRRDITWVAEYSELGSFDRQDPDSLASWIKWFWSKRDAASVRAEGDRLREHLRRWSFVNQNYRVSAPQARAHINPPLMLSFQSCTEGIDRMTLDDIGGDTPTRPNDLRGWEPIYDHRAAVYMRHGAPAELVWKILGGADTLVRSTETGASLDPGVFTQRDSRLARLSPIEAAGSLNFEDPSGPGAGGWRETWLYVFDGGPRMVNFQDSRALGPGPTTMVAVIPLTVSYLDALTVFGASLGKDLYRTRHDMQLRTEGFQRASVSSRCSMAGQRIQQRAAVDFEVAAETDSYTLLFPANLFPAVQVFGMPPASGAGAGTILVAFAAPIENLTLPPSQDGGLLTVPLRLRVSAIDAQTRQTVLRDTIQMFEVDPSASSNGQLSGLIEVLAPAGHYDVRVAVQQADSAVGNVVEISQPVDVWTHGPGIQLSDLVTGGGTDDVRWSFGTEPVPVNPLDAFDRSATVEVFYVQSGLRPGAVYHTTITLQLAEADDPLLSIGFEEITIQGIEAKRRGLALGDIDPGIYQLTLSIREEGSPAAVRQTRLIQVAE